MVVASACRHRASARRADELVLYTGVSRIGGKSFDTVTAIQSAEVLVAELCTTYVFVDKRTLAPRLPPSDIRECLKRFLVFSAKRR
jgi:acyl-CoA thioesterase FadM